MGQEESTLVDDSVEPVTLKSRTLEGLASYISSEKCKKITVLTGAGISTSAGIPDFRSPDTGLYANLARLNLPYAEAVFSIDYFREKPEPFYMLAHELYPGKFRPSITHSFINLLWKKGVLLKHFTQNIDCLDREAGLPGDMTIEAHGSFKTQRCIDCKKEYPHKEMKEAIDDKKIPRCMDEKCNGLVKPDIVFFGEPLPTEFFTSRHMVSDSDLVIVLGTSLTVQPFASLPSMAAEGVPRVLINMEQVGGMGSRADDVLLLEDCDSGVRKIAEACGWLEELEGLWKETEPGFPQKPPAVLDEIKKPKTKDELLDEEIDRLNREVDQALRLNKTYEDLVQGAIDARVKKNITEGSPSTPTAPRTKESNLVDEKAAAKEEMSWKAEGQAADGGTRSPVEKKSAL